MLFTLTVNIGKQSYQALKEGGYKLCICKKVNGVYDIVWSGTADFEKDNNVFQWTESYAVFGIEGSGSETHEVGSTNTGIQPIDFNQVCPLDDSFKMNPAQGKIDPKVGYFTVDNKYVSNSLHVGVKQILNFGTGGADFLPIYLGESVVTGTINLAPRMSVMAFFSTTLKPGMSVAKDTISKAVEISYQPDHTSVTALFNDDQKWEIKSVVQPNRAYSIAQGFFEENACSSN